VHDRFLAHVLCIKVCCSALQCVSGCVEMCTIDSLHMYCVYRCVAVRCGVWQCVAVCVEVCAIDFSRMYCVYRCVAMCCSVLQCLLQCAQSICRICTVYSGAMQYVAVGCIVLRYGAVRCSVCSSVCDLRCSVLHCVAACCSSMLLSYIQALFTYSLLAAVVDMYGAGCCSVVQCVAVCDRVL